MGLHELIVFRIERAMYQKVPLVVVSWCCGLANVLWCDYCSASFQSFSLRHLVKTKKRAKKFSKKCFACAEMFFFLAYETYRFFTLIYFLVARQRILSR